MQYRTVTFPMTFSDLWRSFRWSTYCCYIVCAADAQYVSDSYSFLLNVYTVTIQFALYRCVVIIHAVM